MVGGITSAGQTAEVIIISKIKTLKTRVYAHKYVDTN
jgi:hypothetical protein